MKKKGTDDMKVMTIRVDEETLKKLDEIKNRYRVLSRTHAIRLLIDDEQKRSKVG